MSKDKEVAITALTADEAKDKGPVELVDESRFYNVKIQLGARIRWKKYSGGAWVPNPAKDDPQRKLKGYRHVPAIHDVEELQGKVVNGLIAKHNAWLQFNVEGDKNRGDVSKQLLVLQVTECDPPAVIGTRLTTNSIEMIAAAAARGVVAAYTEAGSASQVSATRQKSSTGSKE